MESRSAQAAPPNVRRIAGAVGSVGDLGRLFRVVARDDRIGGLAPRSLLRCCLSLRHTILIRAMDDWMRSVFGRSHYAAPLNQGKSWGFKSWIVRFFDGADEPACALSTIAFLGPRVGYCRDIYMPIYWRSRGAQQSLQDRTPHGAQRKCRRSRCGKTAPSHTVHASRRLAFLCVIRRVVELGALELPISFENLTVVFHKPQGAVEVDVRSRSLQQTFVFEPFEVGKVA